MGREVQILYETNTESLSIPGNLENGGLSYPTISHSQYTGGPEWESCMKRLSPFPCSEIGNKADGHLKVWDLRLLIESKDLGSTCIHTYVCQLNPFLHPVLKAYFGGKGMVQGEKWYSRRSNGIRNMANFYSWFPGNGL